jgi:hypothetical protein
MVLAQKKFQVLKGEGDRGEYYSSVSYIYITLYIHISYIYENSTMKLTKTVHQEGGMVVKKKQYIGVNLIKVHYMHVVNITMKPLCTINLC